MGWCFYALLPFIPILLRGWFIFRFRKYMRELLSDVEQARETHRTVVLGLAGFSFAGLLASAGMWMSVADPALRPRLGLPGLTFLLSSLFFYAVYRLQGYKAVRWQDHLGDGLTGAATLGLLMGSVETYLATSPDPGYVAIATVVMVVVWGADQWIRWRADWDEFSHRK